MFQIHSPLTSEYCAAVGERVGLCLYVSRCSDPFSFWLGPGQARKALSGNGTRESSRHQESEQSRATIVAQPTVVLDMARRWGRVALSM
jgi:hypothetical protein